MAQVKLLNSGCVGDPRGVNFPVIVEGVEFRCGSHLIGFEVAASELERVGFTGLNSRQRYGFSLTDECEIVEAVNE